MPLTPEQWVEVEQWVGGSRRAAFEARLEEAGPKREHLGDFALAWAAGHGEVRAVQQLDQLVRAARPFVARVHGQASFLDDLHQLALARLVLGDRPRALEYAGQGPLGAWLRALAVRLAIDERRRVSREPLPADEVGVFLGAHLSREEPQRALTAQRVAAAIRAALATLPARERALLRLHHLEGLTLDALAQMYGVHRATLARWLSDARALVLQQTRVQLMTSCGADELSAALDSVQSMLEVSFRQLFEP